MTFSIKKMFPGFSTKSPEFEPRYFYSLFIVFFFSPIICFSQTITKGPYLIEPGSTEMTIRWETDARTTV